MKRLSNIFLYSTFFYFALAPFSTQAFKLPFKSWIEKINIFSNKKQEQITKTFAVKQGLELVVENIKGNIKIMPWNQSHISLEAVKKANAQDINSINILSNSNDKILHIKTKYNTPKLQGQVDYKLLVPKNTNLKLIKTKNGKIRIEDIDGNISVTTEDGAIELINTTQSVQAKIYKCGSIKSVVKNIKDGSIIAHEVNDGSLQVTLPSETSAELSAAAPNGTITSELVVKLHSYKMLLNPKTFSYLRKNIKGTLGDGKTKVILKTKNGSIKILKR